jgi:hypothetical protein
MNSLTKIIFLLIAIVIIAKTPVGDHIPVINASSKAKAMLQQEFANIDPYPSSDVVESSRESRFVDAYVQTKYTASRNWEQIRNHYLDAAGENGWEQNGHETIWQMGKKGEIITFRKGSHILSIETDNIQDTTLFIVTLKWQVYPNFSIKI